MIRAAAALLSLGALGACGGASGGGGTTIANRTAAATRACPAATATFVARFDGHAGRWTLPLAGVPIDDPTGIEPYTTLDAAAAEAAHLPRPPATLWMDGRDGSWCKATPAAVYRALWNEGPTGLEYGVELDTACPAPSHDDDGRVAVAAPRPPAGCHVETTVTTISSRTAQWDQSANTFTPPDDRPEVPRELTALWAAPKSPCTGACLDLWTIDTLSARGKPIVWSIVQTWVTPDTSNLCNSHADGHFEVGVARGSAGGGGVVAIDTANDVFSERDPIAVLDDDGGPRVLVTGLAGNYATYEADSPAAPARQLRYGFPNEEDFAGLHQLGPYCGP